MATHRNTSEGVYEIYSGIIILIKRLLLPTGNELDAPSQGMCNTVHSTTPVACSPTYHTSSLLFHFAKSGFKGRSFLLLSILKSFTDLVGDRVCTCDDAFFTRSSKCSGYLKRIISLGNLDIFLCQV